MRRSTREHLLEIAGQVFAKKGFDAERVGYFLCIPCKLQGLMAPPAHQTP
jgi:hypothetical protein